jgi:hypothetical protein
MTVQHCAICCACRVMMTMVMLVVVVMMMLMISFVTGVQPAAGPARQDTQGAGAARSSGPAGSKREEWEHG